MSELKKYEETRQENIEDAHGFDEDWEVTEKFNINQITANRI